MTYPHINSETTDEELLNLWFEGDKYAFEAFFKRHQGRVAAYGFKKRLSKNDIEDMVQDVFICLHKKIHLYERGRPALPWFFTIVNNICTDWLRKGGRIDQKIVYMEENENKFKNYTVTTESVPLNDDQSQELQAALGNLKAEERNLITMRNEQELSFKEIAKKTGKTEVSLRKSYQRVLFSVKKKLNTNDLKDNPKKGNTP